MGDRISWIDSLKGIGIFLVVLGHSTYLSRPIFEFIYAFHMPLFFFVSGYLFSLERHKNFSKFIFSRVKSILTPYVVFCSITLFVVWIIPSVHLNLHQSIISFVFSIRNEIMYNNPLWFLTALFCVVIIFYILKRIFKHKLILLLVVCLLGLIGKAIPGITYWSVNEAMYYMVFYCIGNLVRDHDFLLSEKKKNMYFYACLIITFVLLAYPKILTNMLYFPRIGYQDRITFFFVSIVIAMIMISAFIHISKKVSTSSILSWLGRNSLVIFGLHKVIFLIQDEIFKFVGVSYIKESFYGVIYSSITILLIVPILVVLNRFLQTSIGKKLSW